jgi:tetratricopeptide (TPR) repeat protein
MATTKRKPGSKKQAAGNDLLENPEVLSERFSKTEEFISKNRTMVFGLGGLIAVIIAVVFIWQYNLQQQEQQAQEEMFQAVYFFEEGNLSDALNGDGISPGFLSIIDTYGSTDAANLAKYYAGIIHLRNREFERALEMFESFSTDDYLVSGRRLVLIGDAYMELGNYTNAASSYEKAATTYPNEWMTPGYLMKAALAHENAGNNEAAIKNYDKVVSAYPNAPEVLDAKKMKAKLEALAAG